MNYTYEIIENLYLGPISVIYAKDRIKFDVIVNCTKDTYSHDADHYYEVPVNDTDRPENIDLFVEHANKILPDVVAHYRDRKKIFVHCSQGVQRSAAFVAILLVRLRDMSLQDAIEYIVLKKPNCFSHGRQVNFMEALNRLV